jgi:hypothetical protein
MAAPAALSDAEFEAFFSDEPGQYPGCVARPRRPASSFLIDAPGAHCAMPYIRTYPMVLSSKNQYAD